MTTSKEFASNLWIALMVLLPFASATAQPTEAMFIRGDADASNNIDVSDPILILHLLLLGERESNHCGDALDVDDNGTVDISDPIYLLGHLFLGTDAPPAPYPFAGTDPSDDSIYSCSDQELSEGVWTILRGVLIDDEAADELGVERGYYRVGSYRQPDHLATSAIVIDIERQHGECWGGFGGPQPGPGSVLPTGSDPWVFSSFQERSYDRSGTSAVVCDSFQNVLTYDIDFGTLETGDCVTVRSVTINGVPVRMSTVSLNGSITTCDTHAGLADESGLTFASNPIDCPFTP